MMVVTPNVDALRMVVTVAKEVTRMRVAMPIAEPITVKTHLTGMFNRVDTVRCALVVTAHGVTQRDMIRIASLLTPTASTAHSR